MPDSPLIISSPDTPATSTPSPLAHVGQVANQHAQRGAVNDYLSRKAENTIRTHAFGLARFVEFLNHIGDQVGVDLTSQLAAFAAAVADYPASTPDIDAWRGISWGLVEGFRNWMVSQGEAVNTINLRLSTVKTFCKLAFKAGVLDATEHALIRAVSGYSDKEAKRVNERRDTTRRGHKKAQHTSITPKQAKKLKQQPDTPQGRRDTLLMCLLLDHGLRCGEVARLTVSDFNLKAGEMRFYRPKVDKSQTHKLSADTARALVAWFDSGDAPLMQDDPLLRGSRKGGALTGPGMSETAISARVRALGGRIGIQGLSAHDCRHYWATFWADKVDLFRLQEAGGWNSLVMPRRYVEENKIANEGMA